MPRATAVWINNHRPQRPPPALGASEEFESSEHRRRLKGDVDTATAIALATLPESSACTADTAVSSSSYVAVTGLAMTYRARLHGALALNGTLYIEEVATGSLAIRIVSGSTVLWSATIQEQGAWLLTGTPAQLGQSLVPIGGPGLVDTVGNDVYELDVEIAAPYGSYKVLTGTGTESWLEARLNPLLRF